LEQWADCESGHFEGRDFRDDDLSRLCTERAVFIECDFSGANLAELLHRGSAFRNCTFERTLLWHWGHLTLAGATFAQRSMLGSSLCNAGCANDLRRGGLHARGAGRQ
jgi:uncharacterized protein YjbI with pentapeptide repeats